MIPMADLETSVQVVCFLSAGVLFANSFILHSHLTLENSIIGKCMSVVSMQDAPGSSLESLILCSHKACDHLFIDLCFGSGKLHVLF